MAGLMYYLPGHTAGVTEETLRGRQLGHLLESEPQGIDTAAIVNGPDGAAGTIVAIQPRANGAAPAPMVRGYQATEQTWQRVPGRTFWIGWQTSAPPRPVDLQRSDRFAGHDVRLHDRQRWHVPVVRMAQGDCAMPRAYQLDEHGNARLQPMPEYAALWQQVGKAYAWWYGLIDLASFRHSHGREPRDDEWNELFPDPILDTEGERAETALQLLALNYRVSIAEVSVLQLLTTAEVGRVLQAAIDWPTVEQDLKKNAAAAAAPNDTPTASGAQG
jgi:hypothetical protein